MQGQVEPQPGRGPTKFRPTEVWLIICIACLLLLATAIIFSLIPATTSTAPNTILYKGKSLDAWFYGSRKDFFSQPTRQAAQQAIDTLGTNAFPFLLKTFEHTPGNGPIYFKIYRAMPARVKAKLPYPISRDDIRAIILNHIRETHQTPSEVPDNLATCLPSFNNPRVRMMGFHVMLMKYQTQPTFLKLCRTLLNDSHPGIRLQGAIYLAQSAIRHDPGEPRLFPILLGALENRQQRKVSIELATYGYQQQPPGTPSRSFIKPPGVADPDVGLRDEIIRALYRLEPYLTAEQKRQFKQVEGRFSENAEHN